ncbi:MAG: DUF393 domain-containing protein [Candidatus Aenigmarchaeota archaeon]|nr:DUF393 domain-containing protein [Gammaproteobacteria bacterium]NIO22071.1 DUF393 domain-containing protein [Candidatus Aenigmarchaeota archaeon]NIT06911.1 DUF393 domain-containing protein [Gammaproteobacteria bacterium]NIT14854.1 DUF393 domain-containing protein [Candidatus Dadabacteria bacterium]
MDQNKIPSPLILFDGVCNLCTGTVIFVIKRDNKSHFKFASLQSPLGQRLLGEFGLPREDFKTFVLVKDDRPYTQSTAVLKVLKEMPWGWPLIYGFIVVPRPIRDWIYRLIAKNRYRLFGKRSSCLIPANDVKNRFLDV